MNSAKHEAGAKQQGKYRMDAFVVRRPPGAAAVSAVFLFQKGKAARRLTARFLNSRVLRMDRAFWGTSSILQFANNEAAT